MDKPALYELTTHHADGSATRAVVPAALAGFAYREALRKAWKAKAGDLVRILPYGVTVPNAEALADRLFAL